MKLSRHSAFTLIELLVVIAIAGLVAAISVPAIKEFGRSNTMRAATQQMQADVARARQLAMSQRTTVYLVFLPERFWTQQPGFRMLPQVEKDKAANILDRQGRGYAMVSRRSVGSQPGQYDPAYLSEWKALPRGIIVAPLKFTTGFPITQHQPPFIVQPFSWTNNIPFPSAEAPLSGMINLPYIAFNHLGQVTDGSFVNGAINDAVYIPLARGNVDVPLGSNGSYIFSPPTIAERPPGNSTNTYNVIRVDRLTGRSRLLRQEVE